MSTKHRKLSPRQPTHVYLPKNLNTNILTYCGDGTDLAMLGVGDCITDDILKEYFENSHGFSS